MRDNMEAVAPIVAQVDYLGESYNVVPVRAGATPEIVRVARPIIDIMLALDDVDSADAILDIVLRGVADHGDALFRAVTLASGIEERILRDGDLAEFAELVLVVYRINRDFFTHRLRPVIDKAKAERAAIANGGGKTTSTSSLPVATAAAR